MIHVRDVQKLEQNLLKLGEISQNEVEQFLKDSAKWYEQTRPINVISRQMFAQLCESMRSEQSDSRRIACGALRTIHEQYESHPDKSRFIARFGVNRISSISNRALRWSGASLSPEDYSEALELFSVAIGDSIYTDDELLRETKEFVSKFQRSPDMFGRLADDLSRLAKVIENRADGDPKRAIARAALVYFLETSDTIPDDLGPVGYIDDAIVVAHALEQVEPERAILSSYLDWIISKWPFLLDLAFEAEGSSYPLSEYSIVNAALLLHDADESSNTGVALIVPDYEGLAFLIGFLTALSQAYVQVRRNKPIEYQEGERLVDRETEAEYIFEGYVDDLYSSTTPPKATHFAVRQPKHKGHPTKVTHAGKGAGDLIIYKSIEHLSALQPSVRVTKTLKTGVASIDISKTKLGPLERLFGSTEPLTLTQDLKAVVVVTQFARAKAAAESLRIFGTPLADILPTGIARCEDDIEFQFWTRKGQGGRPAIIVVRSSSDAIDLVEYLQRDVSAVIVPVRAESTDAANLTRLTSLGVRVLALIEERDQTAVETMERGDFSFWSWDNEWLSYLHWPPMEDATSHHIARYESRLRAVAKANIQAKDLRFPEIDKAYVHLRELERAARQLEDESISSACAEAFITFLGLLRTTSTNLSTDAELFGKLRLILDSAKQWWPETVVTVAQRLLGRLVAAASALRITNQKARTSTHGRRRIQAESY